jgi:hypothetical protein
MALLIETVNLFKLSKNSPHPMFSPAPRRVSLKAPKNQGQQSARQPVRFEVQGYAFHKAKKGSHGSLFGGRRLVQLPL